MNIRCVLQFASRLSEFVERLGKPHLQVWSSQMRRAVRTAEMLNCEYLQWKVLNELDAVSMQDIPSQLCERN